MRGVKVVVVLLALGAIECRSDAPGASSRTDPSGRTIPAQLPSTLPPAASSASDARLHGLLGGPWRTVQDARSDESSATELFVLGDAKSRQIESVWLRAWVTGGEKSDDLAGKALLVSHPFFAGVRLLDSEVKKDGIHLYVETVAALGQPGGIRAVVVPSTRVGFASRRVPSVHEVMGAVPFTAGEDWRSVLDRTAFETDALVELTRRKGPREWAPQGLWVERLWQGMFRERVDRVEADELARHPLGSELRGKLRMLDEALEHRPYDACAGRQAWECARSDGSSLFLGADGKKPYVSALGRDAKAELARGNVAPSDELSSDERTDLEARIARLPFPAIVLLTGRWDHRVPFALVASPNALAPRASLLFAGSVSMFVTIEAAASAVVHYGDFPLEARLWHRKGSDRTLLVLRHALPGEKGWFGVFGIDWLEAPELIGRQETPLGFWARDARSMDETIRLLDSIPKRKVRRAEALGILRASKTPSGFRANATKNAIVFSMKGYWDTGGQVVKPDDVHTSDTVTSDYLAALPDGSEDDVVQNGCLDFFCDAALPFCYCHHHSNGVTMHFWFAQEGGRLKLDGVGIPDF